MTLISSSLSAIWRLVVSLVFVSLSFPLSYATNLHDDLFISIMLVWHSDRISLTFACFWIFTSVYDVTSFTSGDVCYCPPEDTLVAGAKWLNGLGSTIVCGKREGGGE